MPPPRGSIIPGLGPARVLAVLSQGGALTLRELRAAVPAWCTVDTALKRLEGLGLVTVMSEARPFTYRASSG